MKQIYSLSTILLFTLTTLNAQLTDVVTLPVGPAGIALNGNELYITQNVDNKIVKIDITETNPTPIDVISSSTLKPTVLLLKGNDLYIVEPTPGRISKIDITATNPVLTDVVTGLNNPSSIAFDGNILYISQTSYGKISKIDISETPPVLTDIVTGLSGPFGIHLNGNDLYIAEATAGKVSKIDITDTNPIPTDVVTGLSHPRFLITNGNYLYISEVLGGKISKVDITQTTLSASDVVLADYPGGLLFNNNDLYFSLMGSDHQIMKFTDISLSSDVLAEEITFKLFPNPTSDFIQLSGINKTENYSLYNLVGSEVSKGAIKENEKIDVRNLPNGIYVLKIKDGISMKFVKE